MRKLLFFHAPWCPPCRFYEKQFMEPLEHSWERKDPARKCAGIPIYGREVSCGQTTYDSAFGWRNGKYEQQRGD